MIQKIHSMMLALVLVALGPGCRKQTGEGARVPVIQVRTVTAEETTIMAPVRSSGNLASSSESKLSFKTGGIMCRV